MVWKHFKSLYFYRLSRKLLSSNWEESGSRSAMAHQVSLDLLFNFSLRECFLFLKIVGKHTRTSPFVWIAHCSAQNQAAETNIWSLWLVPRMANWFELKGQVPGTVLRNWGCYTGWNKSLCELFKTFIAGNSLRNLSPCVSRPLENQRKIVKRD